MTESKIETKVLVSPSPYAQFDRIINYLRDKADNAYTLEMKTALANRTVWDADPSNPRKFVYRAGVNTEHAWQIYYDLNCKRWIIEQNN